MFGSPVCSSQPCPPHTKKRLQPCLVGKLDSSFSTQPCQTHSKICPTRGAHRHPALPARQPLPSFPPVSSPSLPSACRPDAALPRLPPAPPFPAGCQHRRPAPAASAAGSWLQRGPSSRPPCPTSFEEKGWPAPVPAPATHASSSSRPSLQQVAARRRLELPLTTTARSSSFPDDHRRPPAGARPSLVRCFQSPPSIGRA